MTSNLNSVAPITYVPVLLWPLNASWSIFSEGQNGHVDLRARTSPQVKMRFGGRGGAFSFPQVFHTHSQSVCFVFWPKGGRGGDGLPNGLFLDGGEYGMVQEEGNCCLHISPSQSGLDLHPPSRLTAGTNRSSRHHDHHPRRMDGWMATQSVKHSSAPVGGREQTSPKGD